LVDKTALPDITGSAVAGSERRRPGPCRMVTGRRCLDYWWYDLVPYGWFSRIL